MKHYTRYKMYKRIVNLIDGYEDKIEIYNDEPDGNYFHKGLGDSSHRFVDNLESDGNVDFDSCNKVFEVDDSSCVIIKTFDKEIKTGKKIGTNYSKITLIINNWGLGILQSVMLSEGKMDLFSNLMSGKYSKGTLDDYIIDNMDSHAVVVPEIDKFNEIIYSESEKPVKAYTRVREISD